MTNVLRSRVMETLSNCEGPESLEYRRLIADLTMIYKIVHNLVDVDRNALITFNSTSVARNSIVFKVI